jgi:hypothetical protein
MTDPLQFDIVQSAPGWWGANAFNQLKRREFITLVNMSQIQVGSEEQRLARWVIYAVLAAPIAATLLHDLGVGAVAPWIIYAIIAIPMIAMLFDRKIDVDPLVRWVLFALIALAAILPSRFS